MQTALKRKLLVFSSWMLAAYAYSLAILPSLINDRNFYLPQLVVLSCVAGGFLLYFRTDGYGQLFRSGDWRARRPAPILSAASLLLVVASCFFLALLLVEKRDGAGGYAGRFGAVLGLGFFYFGRLIAKADSA
jgi:hypothetical protein